MPGKDDFEILAPGEPLERLAYRRKGNTEALAAMAGDEHELAVGRARLPIRADRRHDEVERVDPGIAGDEDRAFEPLGGQIGPGGGGRREMQVAHQRDRAPVGFLGEGRGGAIGAQARLDVGDRITR